MRALLERLFFPRGIGERTATFLKGLSWSVAAALISRLISGITTIFAARWLGPSQFGEANLSLASILWIQIPLFWGLPMSLVHHLSKAPANQKEEWVSEGIRMMTLFMIMTVAGGFAFREYWGRLLGIPTSYFLLALLWCVCFWLFTVLKSLLTAAERFEFRSWMEVLCAALFPVVFFIWARRGLQSSAYVLGLSLPYAIAGLGGLIYLRPALKNVLKGGQHSKHLLVYGTLGTLAGVAVALFESPARLIANKVLDMAQVGVLSAYQGGSTQMALLLSGVVAQVLFPIASRTPDKIPLLRKLNRGLWLSFPLQIIFFLTGVALYIKVLGRHYPFQLGLCLIFSAVATLMMINTILTWFCASYGWKGLVMNAVIGISAGVINLLCCQWAIPRFGIAGAGVASILAYVFWIGIFYAPPLQRWLNRREDFVPIV